MKQAMLYGAGDLRLEEKPLDRATLKELEVYVETEVTAMSVGTELGNFEGRSTEVPGAPDYPRTVGYSNVGRVLEVGPGVTRLYPGQRIFALKPHQSGYIARLEESMVPLPDAVSSEQGALAYLAQLGLASLQQAGYQAGEHVVVVGLGIIGLATVALARAMGARVVGVANSPLRAEAGRRVGAHAALLAQNVSTPGDLHPWLGDTGADIVVLTANTWDAYRLSVELARYGGRVSVLGFPGRAQPQPDFNPLDPRWFYGKQLHLIGAGYSPRAESHPWEIRFNLRRNLEYVLERMGSGAINLEPLITHRLPAARMREAYGLAHAHSKELIAAVFDWREPQP